MRKLVHIYYYNLVVFFTNCKLNYPENNSININKTEAKFGYFWAFVFFIPDSFKNITKTLNKSPEKQSKKQINPLIAIFSHILPFYGRIWRLKQ